MLEATLLWESALQNAPVRYGSQRHFIFKLHIKLLKAACMCVSNGEQWFVNIIIGYTPKKMQEKVHYGIIPDKTGP